MKRKSATARPAKEGIKAVIFDYGGTLFKSQRLWPEVKAEGLGAVYALLRKAGLRVSFDEFTRLSDSVFDEFEKVESEEDRDIPDRTKYREIVDRLLPRLPASKRARLAEAANKAFWAVATGSYPMRRSARRTLEHIESKGLRMGVLSNHHNYDSLIGHLQESGIHAHFQVILASEKEGIRKPNTAIFARSLKALGVKSTEAIFVGDSPRHDIVGAKSSGIKTVLIDDGSPRDSWTHPEGLDPEKSRPDYVITDLLELRDIVDSLVEASGPGRRSRSSGARRAKTFNSRTRGSPVRRT